MQTHHLVLEKTLAIVALPRPSRCTFKNMGTISRCKKHLYSFLEVLWGTGNLFSQGIAWTRNSGRSWETSFMMALRWVTQTKFKMVQRWMRDSLHCHCFGFINDLLWPANCLQYMQIPFKLLCFYMGCSFRFLLAMQLPTQAANVKQHPNQKHPTPQSQLPSKIGRFFPFLPQKRGNLHFTTAPNGAKCLQHKSVAPNDAFEGPGAKRRRRGRWLSLVTPWNKQRNWTVALLYYCWV